MRDGANAKLLAGHHAGMLCQEGMREGGVPYQPSGASLTSYMNGS